MRDRSNFRCVANIPIHFGTLANICPTFTLEFSNLHAQFTRCVANIPIHFGTLANVCPTFTLEFSDLYAQFTRCVANLPCGESSGNQKKLCQTQVPKIMCQLPFKLLQLLSELLLHRILSRIILKNFHSTSVNIPVTSRNAHLE